MLMDRQHVYSVGSREISDYLRAVFTSLNLEIYFYSDPIFFLKHYREGQVQGGCIILDLSLPIMNGLELQEQLNQLNNTLPIIFLSAHGTITQAVQAMKAGAFDFIPKPINDEYLISSVQRSLQALPLLNQLKQFKQNILRLTIREKEILNLLIQGRMNKEVSFMLKIAISTVEIHRANIMKKLNVKNIAELIHHYLLSTKDYIYS